MTTAIYRNPLARSADVEGFGMEGPGAVSFPRGRLRLESTADPLEGQAANVVFWCPEVFKDNIRISWDFHPLTEPGLAIMFFHASGSDGRDLFDPSLAPRTGPYDQYHSSDIRTYHVSYFRRMWPTERRFHTCNLRKSPGFHLVSQGADPLPAAVDADPPYRISVEVDDGHVTFAMDGLVLFDWQDDDATGGPRLAGGRIGLRQMAPLVAEYANLRVDHLAAARTSTVLA